MLREAERARIQIFHVKKKEERKKERKKVVGDNT